ncbi:AMP-binding protein [Lutibaculum baratangense]|uniref:Acetyl-coenzyme A synthetase n=1 Tax=Lutibaculum baratangense AMV1 TaxID=631454 RepID=V4RDA2_9HYPH|nr:AMP-binding protein [Lutibaculum baratangense]ESR24126.1 Acetyl-coenzyme A synthetase [Lutibaculum baratangense AMV1]
MLPPAETFDSLASSFRWQVPGRYNIADTACDRWADAEPGRLAIRHVLGDGSVVDTSFGKLRERADRLAHALKGLGLGKGDRVALLLPQCAEVAVAHFAAYKTGAAAVPLALLFGPDALRHRLRDSGARVAVVDALGVAKLAEIRHELPALETVVSIDGADGDALGLEAICAAQPPRFETAATSPDDPALMIYTSGTTGPAKGALHGHRVLLGHLPGAELPHYPYPQPGDFMWTPADWAWAGGLLNAMLPALHHGVPVLAQPFRRFEAGAAFELMRANGVRNAFIPPTALRMMRGAGDIPWREIGLRSVMSAGEPLGREVYEWSREAMGLTVDEAYGQTECNLVLGSCSALGVSRAGRIGRVVPGHEVAVIDGEGRAVRPGEIGQIAVRAPDPVMFLSYWEKPEATAAKFLGSWMLTGDQGTMDEEGYVGFVGRDDDVITSAGYRIGPGEVEDCLVAHPAVALAAVVGQPDPLRTEIVKAFVVLREGFAPDETLAREIQAFVRGRLSAHEYPREIAFIEEMPLTATGKVIRRLLREPGSSSSPA